MTMAQPRVSTNFEKNADKKITAIIFVYPWESKFTQKTLTNMGDDSLQEKNVMFMTKNNMSS